MHTIHCFWGLFLGALAALPVAVQGNEYNTVRRLTPEQRPGHNLDKKHPLASANGSNVGAACFAAQAGLGKDQVQMRPLDDAVADENW